jgi:hypothetical protein
MKVKCVKIPIISNDTNWSNFTIGKTYETLNNDTFNLNYVVRDNNNNMYSISKSCFISIQQWRDKQLDNILL